MVSRSRARGLLVYGLAFSFSLASVELECHIFDETMVCDNEKARLHRVEVRTCSG